MSTHIDAQAKAIFVEALERQAEARQAFIDSACRGDVALRQRVESLLMAASRHDRFLAADPAEDPAAHLADPRPGDRIGNYTLLERLGEGGFGIVFLAQQEHPVRRRVALKIIRLGAAAGLAGLMDPRAIIARFEQERQALAIMDHPNIARVFDAGETEYGRPYFVMELVTGEPITTYCDSRRLSIRERLQLFAQVCRAIEHAHTKGIIHRDIKPGNVLVTTLGAAEPQSDGPVCKVIDFGIAKAIQHPLADPAATRAAFTQLHQLIGTPEYMSPEQASGSPDIDTRTDIYSLGVLAYEMLAGCTPFDPQRLRAAAYGELLRIIREVDPPAPSTRIAQMRDTPVLSSTAQSPEPATSTRAPHPETTTLASIAAQRCTDPRRLTSSIRGDLDWIVMRALEKDPDRRYSSAGNLAADIERHLAGLPIEAAPPSMAYRLRKLARRRRGLVIASSLLAIAILLGSAGTTIGLFRARAAQAQLRVEALAATESAARAHAEAQRADLQAEEARVSARIARSVNELLTTTVKRANRAREQGRADVTVREVMDAAAATLIEAPGSQEPRVELLLAATIGETYRELSLLEQAERMLRLAAQRAREIYGEGSLEHGESLSNLGALLKSRGQRAGAAELYASARAALTAAGKAGERQLALLRINNAALIAEEGRLDEARAEVAASIAWFESDPHEAHTSSHEYFTALHNLAAIDRQRGDPASAAALLRRIVELERAIHGQDDPRTIATLHGLAILQIEQGDLAGAETVIREQLALARRLRGDEHIQVADITDTLANILLRRGEHAAAAESFAQALDITRTVLGQDHSETARRCGTLGGILMDLGRHEQAEAIIREALSIMVPTPSLASLDPSAPAAQAVTPDVLIAWYRLGLLLHQRRALDEAEPLLRSAMAAASVSIREGERYEWMSCALSSLMGAILTARASADELPLEVRIQHLREARQLISTSAERLLVISSSIGPRMRAAIIPAAIERAIECYTLCEQLDPSPEHTAALAHWRQRLSLPQ
jgi:eukaryotic-like serine/threonine-protein kinase